jgi:hypothetical protein
VRYRDTLIWTGWPEQLICVGRGAACIKRTKRQHTGNKVRSYSLVVTIYIRKIALMTEWVCGKSKCYLVIVNREADINHPRTPFHCKNNATTPNCPLLSVVDYKFGHNEKKHAKAHGRASWWLTKKENKNRPMCRECEEHVARQQISLAITAVKSI